jgi:hypothetical protein
MWVITADHDSDVIDELAIIGDLMQHGFSNIEIHEMEVR